MRGAKETRPCAACGRSLTKLLSQAKGASWYCNKQCQLAHMPPPASVSKEPNPYRGQIETRPCAECGAPVTRYLTPARADRPWTCSYKCMGRAQIRRQLEDGSWTAGKKPRRGDTTACVTCGREFYRQPAYIRQNRRFCSTSCWNEAQRVTQIEKTCPQCAQTFSVRPSETHLIHCSRDCEVLAKTKGATGRMHNGRSVIKNAQGYLTVYEPTHPAANRSGRILEHRLVMERKIGRRLSRSEHVNHINHLRDDNRPENLEIMTPTDHSRETAEWTRKKRAALDAELADLRAKLAEIEAERAALNGKD